MRFSLRLNEQDSAVLKRLVAETGQSISELVRLAIQRHGAGTPFGIKKVKRYGEELLVLLQP